MKTHRHAHLCIVAAASLVASTLAAAAPAGTVSPQRNYLQYCSGCHLQDGAGMPSKDIPSMKDKVGRFLEVPGGRNFIVQVPGVMNTPLDDAEVAALMNWILRGMAKSSTPPDTPLYTGEEVKALRATRPSDIPAARRELVDKLRAKGIPPDQLP